jgi:imidazolonepropionase-like amidohydrolase
LTRAIVGGKLFTISDGIIEDGTVVIEKGKLAAVGRREDIELNDDTEVIDASGQWVTPGLIDAHSHIGLFGEPSVWATSDGNEMTDPITPQLRGIDSFNPDDPSIADVVEAGVTAVWTTPGSANVIGGTGFMVKLRGETAREMAVPGTEQMKMALGENPKRVYGKEKQKFPATRMANAAALRTALVDAQNYLYKRERAQKEAEEEGKEPNLPERNLKWEALGRVLTRDMKARIHCHRADDILTAIRIAREFDLDFALEHVTEGYKIAEILADEGVQAIVGPLFMGRGKMEIKDVTLENPGKLAEAGVHVSLQMDTTSGTKWLPVATGLVVREGMEEEEAFRAITLNPAEVVGVDDRMGSLEVGKDADIAIFDGHPFHTYTRCVHTIIEGETQYCDDNG